jgi:hypothetical protein
MKTIAFVAFLFALTASAKPMEPGITWHYQLIADSGVMNECLPCAGPSFWVPLEGSFDLVGTSDPKVFKIENLEFVSSPSADPEYRLRGGGALSLTNGQPEITVSTDLFRFNTIKLVRFTNSAPEGTRIFPMLSLRADEDSQSTSFRYRMRIYAAPIREIWFSPGSSFTRGNVPAGTDAQIGEGDLLSRSGRIVKRNAVLTERLSLPPSDVGLDALDIGPRGEIFFSTTTDAQSIVNGPIGNGDIVTSEGRLYLLNSQLLAPFSVTNGPVGLDALHMLSEDEIYFSIAKEAQRSAGAILKRGDILSSKGKVIRTESALLLRFINPLTNSVGVDALFVWPNGEIWFSTEESFNTSSLGAIAAGDILSDQGYVVARNLDLLAPFAPVEDRADFGLDAMTIVTDVAASTAVTQIGEMPLPVDGTVELMWDSAARVFQVEAATVVDGPYAPVTDMMLERRARLPANDVAEFFRVRQW